MAQGTFDLLHPGHLHYLEESAALGDEMCVVIARDSRMREKKSLVMDEESRRNVVDALNVVDEAVLGSEEDIFDSVKRLQPDIITIGYDQPYDPDKLESTLSEHGFDGIQVVRIGKYEGDVMSSSQLRTRAAD